MTTDKDQPTWHDVMAMVSCGSLLRNKDASPSKPSPVLDASDVCKIAHKRIDALTKALARAIVELEGANDDHA